MNSRISVPALAAALLLLILCEPGGSQQEDLRARRLWEVEIIAGSAVAEVEASTESPQRPVYLVKKSSLDSADPSPGKLKETDSFVGVTVWRLRPARPNDEVTLTSTAEISTWTPERMDAAAPLRDGDRVRMSIESPWDGYLYVIDRERYSDGSTSDPYLIFPTANSRGGDNAVTAGRVIEIPAQTDRIPYFRLDSQRAGRQSTQTAELISVVVAPARLPELEGGTKASSGPVKLPAQKVAQWEDQWGVETEVLVLVDGIGKPWTRVEREAGMGARLLVQQEPFPQNIFRVLPRPGAPVMVNLSLLIEQ